jgi:hypothetical protein
MNINSAFTSDYLKASDIPEGQPINVRIERVDVEDLGQGKEKETKPVLYFIGKTKGLVLNKTNANTLSGAFGPETDYWRNKAVQIVATEVEYQGKLVPALRIRIPKPTDNGGGQAAPLRARGEEIRSRAPVESPIGEESQFNEDEIQF